MLNSIHLKNFFSFSDTEITLHPQVNVLIGINGSGKSNLLKAIKLLREGVAGKGFKEIINSDFGGYNAMYNYTNSEDILTPIEITFEFDAKILSDYGFIFTNNVLYQLTIKRSPSSQNFYLKEQIFSPPHLHAANVPFYLEIENGIGVASEKPPKFGPWKMVKYDLSEGQESALKTISDPDRYPALYALRKAIADIGCYEIFDTRQRSKLRQPMSSTAAVKLDTSGDNLPQVLNTIRNFQKDDYKDIKKMLNRVNNGYTDINYNIVGGNIELMLEEDGLKRSVHVAHISDGTLQFLCLLAILKNKNAGSMISIDEPEVRLHPDMINSIANSIFQASEQRQFFIATHSEHLLNSFKLEHIRVFEKNEHNCTIVQSFNEEQFAGWYDEFSVGQMWRKNDLGGNTTE